MTMYFGALTAQNKVLGLWIGEEGVHLAQRVHQLLGRAFGSQSVGRAFSCLDLINPDEPAIK